MGVELTDCGQGLGSFPGGSVVKKKIHLPIQDMWFLSLHWEDPLQKEMATHSSVLAWRATVMEPQRVRHDLGTKHQQQIQP